MHMPVDTIISKEKNLIVHTLTGVMDLSVIVNTISKTLDDPEYQVGMNAIWHFCDTSKVNLSSEDLMYAAEYAGKKMDEDGKPYKLALVAEEDLSYGLTRVYEAWRSKCPVTVQNFRFIDDAFAWIESAEIK